MSAEFTITLSTKTRFARLWLRSMLFIAPLVGAARAVRWAEFGWWRLVRVRIGRGEWKPPVRP